MAKSNNDDLLAFLKRIESKSDCMSQSLATFDKKLDLHIQKTEYELRRINEMDEIQNKLLDQHIEGVNTLKKMHEAHEKIDLERFDRLESPRKWFKDSAKVLIAIGTFAGAVAGFLKLFHIF